MAKRKGRRAASSSRDGAGVVARLWRRLRRAARGRAKAGPERGGGRTRASAVVAANLRRVEAWQGPLPAATRNACDDYAVEVLGDRRYARYLYLYSAVAGAFREGWIPTPYFKRVVLPTTNGQYGQLAALRAVSPLLHPGGHSPDLAYQVNGALLGPDCTRIDPATLAQRLFEHTDTVVFKADDSKRGRGIHVIERDAFDSASIAALGDGVFQTFVRQHDAFAAFVPSAVATMRMTTAVDDAGLVSLRAAYLRLGRSHERHVRPKSSVRVPIDRRSCTLAEFGYSYQWERLDSHPDTGTHFGGRSVPSFDRCVGTVEALHRRFPHPRVIGWDVTVDTTGAPIVLEWNARHPGITLGEATQGPVFADLGWERLWRHRGRAGDGP